ncbi:MAG: NADH-quinone oxidoreductase subunit NuoK [Calditrichaeota bacterium]|nr:NADH-quinone oxidoreductase subunit NuoK [Calditrichota bacterium]
MNNLTIYLTIGVILFVLGLVAVLTSKNLVKILMGVELILNASGLNFIAFSRFVTGNLDGQLAALFIIVVAASEAAVALAIILNFYRQLRSIDVNLADSLRG